jgi:hypothetical protein
MAQTAPENQAKADLRKTIRTPDFCFSVRILRSDYADRTAINNTGGCIGPAGATLPVHACKFVRSKALPNQPDSPF